MRKSTSSQDRGYRSSKRRSSPKGKSDTRENFYCDYCKQQFLSKSVYQEHCKSEFHKDKVSFILKATEANTWLCHSCEKAFDAKVTLDQHCLMLRHQALYRVEGMPMPGQVAIFDDAANTTEDKSEPHESRRNSSSGNKFYCTICDVDCLNISNHKIHLESWRHRAAADRIKETKKENEVKEEKQRNSLKLNGKLPNCHMCNIICDNEKMYLHHLEESRHVKKIAVMRSPYNCSVCKVKIEKQSAFNAHLSSHGHIERAAKDDPNDSNNDAGKFKKAFQKPKGRSSSPDLKSNSGRSKHIGNESEDLRVHLTKEKKMSRFSRSPVPPPIPNQFDEGPTLVDYRHDSSATVALSETDSANLRRQLMKEREEEWAKYKKLEDDYRRLCVDEEYIRRRIPFYEETDPRRLEDTAVLLKIQKSLSDINQELIFRDKMIQEKENFILGTKNEESKPPPIEVKPQPDDRMVERLDDATATGPYFNTTERKTSNAQSYPEKTREKTTHEPEKTQQSQTTEAPPAKVVKQEQTTPKKEHKKERSSSKRSTVPKENTSDAQPDKEEYLYMLIADTLHKEREKIAKRITPELNHLDAGIRNRIIKLVFDRETDSESAAPSEKERRKKHSKHKRHSHSKERQSSLADELQVAARRMMHDQNGAPRPDPSVLLEQERKKLFGKDNVSRSTKKRRRSKSSDDSSDSSESSDNDSKSRRRNKRKQRKNDKYDDDRSHKQSKKDEYTITAAQSIGVSHASALNPQLAYQSVNAMQPHPAMAARAGIVGMPPGYNPGFPPPGFHHGVFPPGHYLPPGMMPPSVHPPPTSNEPPVTHHQRQDVLASIPIVDSQGHRGEDPYEDLPPTQSPNQIPQQSAAPVPEPPTSRYALDRKRNLPALTEAQSSPARSQQEQLNEIFASGVLDKIGVGSNINVVDLLREQLANLDKGRVASAAASQEKSALFPSAQSIKPSSFDAPTSNNPTPIKSILKKRATSGDEGGKDQSTDEIKDSTKSPPIDHVLSNPTSLPNFSVLNEVVSSLTAENNQTAYERSLSKFSGTGTVRSLPPPREDPYSKYISNPQQHGDDLRRDLPPPETASRDYVDKDFYGKVDDHVAPQPTWKDDSRREEYDSYSRRVVREPEREPAYREAERHGRYDHSSDITSGSYPAYPNESSSRYAEPIHHDVPEYRRRERDDLPPGLPRPRDPYHEPGRRSFPEGEPPPPHHDRRYDPPPPDRRVIAPRGGGYGPPPRRGRPR